MAILVDTNLLVRLANLGDSMHVTAAQAVVKLHRQGEILHVTPQNLIEYHAVATRPIAANGLGQTLAEADGHAATFLSDFPLLPDVPAVFPAWQAIVKSHGIVGKQVHDARLVAVCHVHRVTHLLTFDIRHFARIATASPGIVLIDPATV
jgi:predicted nucleic acid-binding protein